MDNLVRLSIKNVYDGGSVTQIELPFDNSSIKDLKHEIQKKNSDHPEPQCQRIIYCGKICQDETQISQLLAQMDQTTVQTFHLVLNRSPTQQSKKALDEKNLKMAAQQRAEPVSSSSSSYDAPSAEAAAQVSLSQQLCLQSEPHLPVNSVSPTFPFSLPAMLVGPSVDSITTEEMALHLLRAHCDPQYMAHQHLLRALADSNGPSNTSKVHLQMPPNQPSQPSVCPSFPRPPPGTQVTLLEYVAPSQQVHHQGRQEGMAQQAQANAQQLPVGGVFVLDTKLLLKLAFMIFMLGQGRDWYQIFGLFGAAIFAYLVHTGMLVAFWQAIQQNRSPRFHSVPGTSVSASQPAGGSGLPVPQTWVQATIRQVRDLHRGTINPSQGRIADACVLLLTFFFSLFPAWRPVANENNDEMRETVIRQNAVGQANGDHPHHD